jgi:uncharacterized repeat protein (TIGR04002 family)
MLQRMRNKTLLFNLTLGAIFAAAIFIVAYLFQFKLLFGANINLGDTLIYIIASILPTPFAMAAAVIGSSLSDTLSGFPLWVPADIVIKALLVLYFTRNRDNILCKRNIAAVFLAGVTGLLGYFAYDYFFVSFNVVTAFTNEVAVGFLQPVICGILYIVVAASLDKAKIKQRISKFY